MAESSASCGRPRKWRRRVLRSIAVLMGLLVLLLAVAPSLLFNRSAAQKLSGWASGFLGRPVVIEDIRFGWRTPLHAGRITIPAIDGEDNYPLLDIRGVSIHLSLGRIAMLPPYSLSIDVEKIEFNLVKTKNGETNLAKLLSKFAGQPAKKPVKKPAGGKLPALPLKNIGINLKRIDVRYVDMTKGLTAGLEGGGVFLHWTGGNEPLAGKLVGNIRLNRTVLPWELGVNLRSWVDANRQLTLDTAVLTVDSGGGTNAPIFLDLSIAAGRKSIVHAELPMDLITRVNDALGLVPAMPGLAGSLDLRLAASHEGVDKKWDISSTLLIKDIKVTGGSPAAGQAEKPLPGTDAAASTNVPAPAKGFDGSLGIGGSITLITSVTLPQPAGSVITNDAASRLVIRGELVTAINSLDVTAGKAGVSLADFVDRRRFEVSVDPASPATLSYADDAHTGLAAFEGTMGIAVGKCALDAKARFAPPGVVIYDIGGAEVNDVVFASPALQLTVPPVKFSGAFITRLKDCTFEGKDLRLGLGNFITATCAPFFNWTNGTLRVAAGAELKGLSNLLTMVQFKATNTASALPRLTGGLSGTINLHGTVPKTSFAPGQPLPVAGDINVRLNDIGVDLGPNLSVRGINAEGSVNLSEDGRDIRAALGLNVANVATGNEKVPPLTNIHIQVTSAVHDFDRVEMALKDFGIDSLRTSASARLAVGGLLAALSTNATGVGAIKWLHALSLDGAFAFNQDLKGVTGLVPGLDCDGNIGVSASFINSPMRALSAAAGLELRDLRINLNDKIKVSGINGAWSLTKTFLAPGEGRQPVPPRPGRIVIDSVALKSPKLALEMHKIAVSFQGLEQGMTLSLAVPDLIGGPTEAACSLSMRGNNPELAAKITVTGLNGGAFFPDLRFKNRGDGDINAVVDVSLVLPPDPRGMLLDYVNLKVRTMRIGKDALVRILKAMDSRQETPQFQSAIAALSLGTPVGAQVLLANSLVSISAELLVAGGVRLTLPVLDSAPLSDIMGVYKLEGTEQKLEDLRRMLLLLMTNDLTELEKSLAGASQ